MTSRTGFVDRKRLIEARVARDCELLRREIVMSRAGSKEAAAASSASKRVATR